MLFSQFLEEEPKVATRPLSFISALHFVFAAERSRNVTPSSSFSVTQQLRPLCFGIRFVVRLRHGFVPANLGARHDNASKNCVYRLTSIGDRSFSEASEEWPSPHERLFVHRRKFPDRRPNDAPRACTGHRRLPHRGDNRRTLRFSREFRKRLISGDSVNFQRRVAP